MLFKSGLVTQISGSIGGLTGSHNKGGMYFRARSIPTNPATPLQIAVRNAMNQLVTRWNSTLTAPQRAAWEVYAENVLLPNPLGDPRQISGQNHYVRSNVPRLQAGVTIIDPAPTTFDLGTFSDPSFGFDATADEIDVTFDNTDTWANEDNAHLLVYGSSGKNLSINFFKGPYRFAGTIDGDAITAPTSPASLPYPHAVDVGNRYFAQIRVSRADGRLSSPFRGLATGV